MNKLHNYLGDLDIITAAIEQGKLMAVSEYCTHGRESCGANNERCSGQQFSLAEEAVARIRKQEVDR